MKKNRINNRLFLQNRILILMLFEVYQRIFIRNISHIDYLFYKIIISNKIINKEKMRSSWNSSQSPKRKTIDYELDEHTMKIK